MKLPSNMKAGDYAASVQIEYGLSFTSASDNFSIIEEEIAFGKDVWIPFLLIILIIKIYKMIIKKLKEKSREKR